MPGYSPAPHIPPGLDPKAWTRMVEATADEGARLVEKATRTGRLGVGDSSRYASLTASLRASHGLDALEAGVAARTVAPIAQAAAQSLDTLSRALPAHAAASVADLERFLSANGFNRAANPRALGAATSRVTQAMTADWTRMAARTQDGIVDATLSAMALGDNPRDAARRMRGLVTDQGGMAYGRAQTIARTEMADLYDSARIGYMKENADTLEGWWWRARPDACAICQIQHGMKFGTSDPPERHHNCRCLMVPIPEGRDGTEPGEYLPGMARDRSDILPRLPKKWDPPADLRSLVQPRPNPGWRPSLTLQPPGTKPALNWARVPNGDLDNTIARAIADEDWDTFDLAGAEWDRRLVEAPTPVPPDDMPFTYGSATPEDIGVTRVAGDLDTFAPGNLEAATLRALEDVTDAADEVVSLKPWSKEWRKEWEVVHSEWEEDAWLRFLDAEHAGGGIRVDLAEEARREGIGAWDLFTATPEKAYKYANEEMLKFWADTPGRTGRGAWFHAEYKAEQLSMTPAQYKRWVDREDKALSAAQERVGRGTYYEAEKARKAAASKRKKKR